MEKNRNGLFERISDFFKNIWHKLCQAFPRRDSGDEGFAGPYTSVGRPSQSYTPSPPENRHSNKLMNARQKREELDRAISVTSGRQARFSQLDLFKPRKRPRSFFLGTILTTLKILLVLIFMVGAAGLGGVIGLAQAYMETTPTLDTNKIENQAINSYIYDANGELVTVFTGTENRDWANLSEIPQTLKDAFIAVEDVRFYYHSGVDIKRLFGAVVNNLLNENVQGGSTITQQLIKNRLLTTEQTYKRKIQEAYLSLQLENEYTKDDILEAYLNTIPLGGLNYGVKAAAQDYFGKSLDELTLRESACIAGLTQSPYKYDPRRAYYVTGNTEDVNERTDLVLRRMYTANLISKSEYEAALKDELKVVEKSSVNSLYKYPYFVEYAVNDVINQFLYVRNLPDTPENRSAIENEMRTNGYSIYTTLDPGIQDVVQSTLSNFEGYPQMASKEYSVLRKDNADGTVTEVVQPQAAAVVYDHNTGELKAIVGGRNEPDRKKATNLATASMPVGSSIKPISVYGPAIDIGYSPATTVANIPVPIEGWNTEKGYPSTPVKSYGPVTLRKGLTSSLNIATARALVDLVGYDTSKNYLVELGVNPSYINEDGPGLALGTSGISTVEMAAAYGAIANEGEYLQPLSFTTVKDKNGQVILDAAELRTKRQVFKPSTAYMLTDMLINAVKSGTGTRAKIDGMTVGGKTGTNEDQTLFFAGITPYYTATVWIGHENYKTMKDTSASKTTAPLWQSFMSKILEGKEDKPIIDKTPDELGIVTATVCGVSGKLVTEACKLDAAHPPVTDIFLNGTVPTEPCDMHHDLKICSYSNQIATPFCPPETSTSYNVIVPPKGSPYEQYPEINGTLPYPMEVLQLIYDNEASYINGSLTEYYCYVHNQSYDPNAPVYDERTAAVQDAQMSLFEANNYLMSYGSALPPETVNRLNTLISDLTVAIDDIYVDAYSIRSLTSALDSALAQAKGGTY